MSDFTSGFWDYYIGVLTVVSMLACGVLLKMQSRRKVASDPDKTPHVWDEDLQEFNNPLPAWWIMMFYLTIAFSLVYLVFYPGLGSWKGQWNWSSAGQYTEEVKKAEAEVAPLYEKFAKLDLAQLAADPQAKALGQRLFLNYCAQCHSSDGGGSKGFPNLTDKDWLYGGDEAAIKATILNGRNGIMPPFGPALGAEGAKDVANYVRSMSGLTADTLRVTRGKDLYAANCVACHGADGKGNQQLGAPNLTDQVWLYGSLEPAIIETVVKGRNNAMPAHKDFLGEARVHVLAGYVYGLSNAGGAAPPKPGGQAAAK
jgi:cytochrome c oxidase cbb3-type subunit 3